MMPLEPQRWWAIGVALPLVLIVVSCTAPPKEEGLPGERPALVARSGSYAELRAYNTLDVVDIFTAAIIEVTQDVRLTSVEIPNRPPEVLIRDARANFLRTKSTRKTFRGYPGFLCTNSWPPKGYSEALLPVEGLRVRAGDSVAITLMTSGSTTGRWSFRGVRVNFENAQGVQTSQVVDQVSVEMRREETEDDLGVRRSCDPKEYPDWFQY